MSSTATRAGFDPSKAEAFAGRILTALNNGALCLMLSVGHRTGLFDVLSALPPATSEEIATRAGLHERYVREWLGAMATAGVVEVDAATTRFTLPAEHAAFLTRAVVADNMAVFAQYIGLFGAVEDDIVACFRQGGEGLGAMWGEDKTREYLQRAGFRSIETQQLAHDIQNNWYVVRK
jgi:hypothetical protein